MYLSFQRKACPKLDVGLESSHLIFSPGPWIKFRMTSKDNLPNFGEVQKLNGTTNLKFCQ